MKNQSKISGDQVIAFLIFKRQTERIQRLALEHHDYDTYFLAGSKLVEMEMKLYVAK